MTIKNVDLDGAKCNDCGTKFTGVYKRQDLLTHECAADKKPNAVDPDHYKAGGIETIDYLRAKLTPEQFAGYCLGNVLKYCSRFQHKAGVEDLKKAQVYLNWLVEGADKT